MTAKYDHIAATKYLSNLCKDGTPLRGRIALLSFRNEISAKGIDTVIMIVEYAQLLAIFLRSVQRYYPKQTTNNIELYNFLLVFIKFFSPGNLLPANKDGLQIINRVLEFCFAFYLIRILLFAYIIWLAFRRKTNSGLLVRPWQWIFYPQTKVLFSVFTSIYSNTYENASKGSLGLDSHHRYAYMALCIIMIVLEFSLSFLLTTQFTNVLPFKRFSASKDNSLELNVLMQKFLNHILRRTFHLTTNASLWIYNPMNILFGLARIYYAFHKLPVYNYKALKFQIYLLIITFTASIACFANVAVDRKKSNMNFVIIFWIILTIFCIPIVNAYLERKLWALAFEQGINTKRNPETLIHKIIFIKYILTQNKLTTAVSSKANIHRLLCETLTPNFPDLDQKNSRNKIFMHYLEDLMAQFPKNNFLKLYSAYRYARKAKLYGLSIKTLAEINSNYPTLVASKSILKHFIQTKTQSDYQNKAYLFNLYDYCKGVADLSKLKLKMAEQAKFQSALCHEITSEDPDLAEILRLGNKAQHVKKEIEKKFQKMSDQMPDWFIKPSLLYAYYNLSLGYSSEDHSKYKEIYAKKFQKYHRQFENDKILPENLFQDDTFIIVVSGEKETAGLMNYLSPGLMEVFGRNLTGVHASVITPPFIRPNAIAVVKSLMGPNALMFQNTERSNYFYNIKGYMTPINYYLNINPSIYGGLSFIFICRAASESKDYILLNEDGEIETFTKNIGEQLGLLSSSKDGFYDVEAKTPISQICPEFTQINQAFNLIASPSSPEIDQSEAKEIFRVYSEGGQNITLTPIIGMQGFLYHCTVKTLMVGTKIGKILTLDNNQVVVEDNFSEDLREDVNSEWINFDRLRSARNELNQNTLSSHRIPLMIERGVTEEKLLLKDDDLEITPKLDSNPQQLPPHWLKNSQVKISELYQQALDKPYSPFFYRVFIIALYTLFLIVFIMYLYMSVNMHQGISDLQVSKQILRMAEARNNYLGTLDGTTRFLWTYATQPWNINKFFKGTIVSLPFFLLINQYTLNNLEIVNDKLFALTSSLDKDQREKLFHKDIRMFDANSTTSLETFINLTSFQATDRVIEASLKSNALVQTNLRSAIPSLKFVLSNVMNDMLVKNAKVSQSFGDYLQDKKNYFENWITVYFSCSLCFLIFIVFGYIYVLYLQAKSENSNLLALTKLKPQSINSLKQDLLVFHDLILEDHHHHASSTDKPKKNIKKIVSRKIKQQSRGLWPIYYLYFSKVGLLILIPMILFLANFVLFKKYLNQLSTKAAQLSFIEQMNSRFGVISGSFLELTSENDTTTIYNVQASVALTYQISKISEMIQSISDILGVGASEENSLIQDVLYGDACAYLKESPYLVSMCQSLANYQEKPGLTNLLSNLETSIKFVYAKFFDSNRTSQALLSLQVEAYNEITSPVFLVIQVVNNLIAEELNSDFEHIVSHSQSLNITLNAVILALIVVESLIIHFLVINKLKQKETQFKQILGLFPASIVLPNFILKSYIMKTSNQTFNSFRGNS